MEKIRRTIFFWTLVLVFFIVAPMLVLYATGYRFDWKKGVFVHSGTITFKSNPQNVTVTLNGEVNESSQINRINKAYNISGLLPGDYEIKVSAPGFYPWSKKADVHSGLSSEFWNIILTRENYEKISFAGTQQAERFYISPENKSITYAVNDPTALKIGILNINDEAVEQTFSLSGWKLAGQDKKENIEWSPREDYLSVPVTKISSTINSSNQENTDDAYYSIDLGTGEATNINDFFGKKVIRNVRWDPQEKGFLFFISGAELYRADIKDKTSLKLIATNVSAYDLSKTKVYYVENPNNLVFSKIIQSESAREQITNSFPKVELKSIKRLIVYDEIRIAFLDEDNDLFVYNNGDYDSYFKKLGDNVSGMHFSDDGKKMLFWTNNEISVYFLRDWMVQPIRYENELSNITRYSETLSNVQWFKDYEHIIFSSGKYTKIVELDSRDNRNCLDLIATTLDPSFMIYDNALERLFYTDSVDGETKLNYIVFPEKIPLLGLGD